MLKFQNMREDAFDAFKKFVNYIETDNYSAALEVLRSNKITDYSYNPYEMVRLTRVAAIENKIERFRFLVSELGINASHQFCEFINDIMGCSREVFMILLENGLPIDKVLKKCHVRDIEFFSRYKKLQTLNE